jgi:signal-transduction protein with cAMP-binding, CBS, and nucleotidyltransferase domain
MTLSEKIFALKSVRPFDVLRDGELALIAQEARVRQYGASEIVANADKPIRRLHVVTNGDVRRLAGGEALPVFGVKPLLFNQGADEPLAAGVDGATCLTIKRGNFFTIANECPGLIVGFLDLAEQGLLI